MIKFDMGKVILDVLGGDNGAASTLDGAIKALKTDSNLTLLLVGDENQINAKFGHLENLKSRIEILHTTVNIEMGEKPTEAIRTKPTASIVLGLDALRKRTDCAAFVSAGSTGAVLTGGFMRVGRLEGGSRPALSCFLPTIDRKSVLLSDTGANVDCKPVNLDHFAVMADVYLKAFGVKNPRIALLSVGTEDEKGNELTHEVFAALKILKDKLGLNFVGNMEARDAVSGKYDAIITDGFAGNVLLKGTEGAAKLFSSELKKAISGATVLPAKLMLANRLLKMKRSLSDDAVGGAIFLGLKKPVFKTHGNATPNVICNTILNANILSNLNLSEKLTAAVAKCNDTIKFEN
jgi:glycerol-3-phosphate acyltransferase PlsX